MQRIIITIDEQLKQELDNITEKGGRAGFINQAIKTAIEDWHKQQALKTLLSFKPYKSDKNSLDILDEIRTERIGQLINNSGF